MTTFEEARSARIAAATPQEWRDLVADMLDEMKAFDDAVESKAIRYVKTPAGARKYGEPIGAPIHPNAPKLSYVRNGPKKRSSGPAPTSTGSGSSPSFRSVDVSPEATKKVTDLTPGERSREKARLAKVVKDDPKNSSLEKRRLSDIEEHENELDKTVRSAGKPATSEAPTRPQVDIRPKRDSARDSAGDKPVRLNSEADSLRTLREDADKRAAADDARDAALKQKQRAQARTRELDARQNRAETDRLGKPEVLTDRQLGTQITDIQQGGSRSTRAQRDRLDALLAERDRRDNGGRRQTARSVEDSGVANQPAERRLTPEQRNGTSGGNSSAVSPTRLTDANLQSEMNRLAKKKSKSSADRTRAQYLLAEFNRRNAEDQLAQARRLIGRKSFNQDDLLIKRLEVSVKAYHLVGDGDWDCSEMDDDDIQFFLTKSLRGRPTVEKLQMADALLAERADRLGQEQPEVKELVWETVPKA